MKAFELRATDFVVKPVSGDRLSKRARPGAVRPGGAACRGAARLSPGAAGRDGKPRAFRIGSRASGSRSAATDAASLCRNTWLEAERDYVRVHMNGQAHLVNAMLGDMEKALDGQPFLRVHRSAIVRMDKVRAVLRGRFSRPCWSSTTASGCRSAASIATRCGPPSNVGG